MTTNAAKNEGDNQALLVTSRRYLPESTSAEEVVYCWPFTAENVAATKQDNMRPVPVSTVLALGSIIAFFTQNLLNSIINGHGSGFAILGAAIAAAILAPLYLSKSKKIAFERIRIAPSGIHFEYNENQDTLAANKRISWQNVRKIYLIGAKPGKSVLSSALVVEAVTQPGSKPWRKKIPLSKIRTTEQWHNLVSALREKCPLFLELDETLLDGQQQADRVDPSYTRLWYEALTAAPKRERLQPLSAATQLQDGAYLIERQIGTGGQGTAYLARNRKENAIRKDAAGNLTSTNASVVLKEYILPVYVDHKIWRQALEEFEHEVSMLRTLKHPGIVSLLDAFVQDHRGYLVLEYVDGKSLKDLVRAQGPLKEMDCLKLAKTMCEILRYLHEQSPPVVHQDFTPDNLLLAQAGELKLIDFMVAKQQVDETCTSTVVGKHHYMPPEQFRGQATTQSDIYALGATLHFILAGHAPEPMSESHPILVNEDLSAELDQIVARATALDPALRYQRIEELESDLERLIASRSAIACANSVTD